MPCARGIQCFLSTNHGKDLITEYSHPEGMSMKLGDNEGPCRFAPSPKQASDGVSSSPFSIRGTKKTPTVSVYVPSVPGSPFSIHYQIDRVPPSPCKYLFFKVHINGRQIVAWGIDTASDTKGRISQSLWLPGTLYSGMVGMEKRSLLFLPGQEKKSVAEDGGLIEIQAFRASARQSRAPVLDEFYYHDNYGVATPSVGLVSEPQSMAFYSYVLIDPKDVPYAIFRLHYRSEASLRHLNLIPDAEPPTPYHITTPHPADDVFAPTPNSSSAKTTSVDTQSYRFRPLPALPIKTTRLYPIPPRPRTPSPVRSAKSPAPSLMESICELLRTGELDPEDVVFLGPVSFGDGPSGASPLVAGEKGRLGGGGSLDTKPETPLRWERKERKGTMGSTGSPVRRMVVGAGLLSGFKLGRKKGAGD